MDWRSFFQETTSGDPHSESAWQQASRTLGPTIRSAKFVLWLLVCEAAIAGYAAFASAESTPRVQGVVTSIAIIGAAIFAIGTAFVTLAASAPVRQRDHARDELRRLTETSEFPNVTVKAEYPMIFPGDDQSLHDKRATIVFIKVRATNRETKQRAILEFKAVVEIPNRGPWSVRRPTGPSVRGLALLSDPLTVEPQDFKEGDLAFAWEHDMDFLLGRDLSEDAILDAIAANFRLAVHDHLSTVTVSVELPEKWTQI